MSKEKQEAVRHEMPNGEVNDDFGAAYGGELAVKVVMEIWQRLDVLKNDAAAGRVSANQRCMN